jgi:hypothetical protein
MGMNYKQLQELVLKSIGADYRMEAGPSFAWTIIFVKCFGGESFTEMQYNESYLLVWNGEYYTTRL